MSLVIYEPEFNAGFSEVVAQQTDIFNGASNGCIILTSESQKGNYNSEAFFKAIANLVTRRDITSDAAASALALDMDELISVKLNRKIGPLKEKVGNLLKLGGDSSTLSFVLGKQVGMAVAQEMANTSIAALVAGITAQAALLHDYSATGTITHGQLVIGMSKRGDRSQECQALVMHSKPYFDLVGQAITDKVTEVAGATIYSGTVATLGRPSIVIDAPALYVSGVPDKYYTLGLVPGACAVVETEARTIKGQDVLGEENLKYQIQGEYAYNVGMKGLKWDIANGGANPDDATLATTTNWDKAATDDKDLPGFAIYTQ